MNESTSVRNPHARIGEQQPSGSRRSFLKSIGGEVLGAAAIAAGISGSERVGASPAGPARSADVFIGKSPAAQAPRHVIESPLYFMNGQLAGGFHTLDVSTWRMTGVVTGSVTSGVDTIEPDFTDSAAAAITHGSDGDLYLVVAAEGNVTGGKGVFAGVNKAIFRGKYKVTVDPTGNPLLTSCADCVIVLTRDA